MKKQIFAVFDAATQLFLEPFFCTTVEEATRGFRQACEKEGHQFAMYPEDYVLYHLGSWDAETAAFDENTVHKVAMASAFTRPFGNQLKIDEGGAA